MALTTLSLSPSLKLVTDNNSFSNGFFGSQFSKSFLSSKLSFGSSSSSVGTLSFTINRQSLGRHHINGSGWCSTAFRCFAQKSEPSVSIDGHVSNGASGKIRILLKPAFSFFHLFILLLPFSFIFYFSSNKK